MNKAIINIIAHVVVFALFAAILIGPPELKLVDWRIWIGCCILGMQVRAEMVSRRQQTV